MVYDESTIKGNKDGYVPDYGYFAPFAGFLIRSIAFIIDLVITQVAILPLSLLLVYLVTHKFGLPEPPVSFWVGRRPPVIHVNYPLWYKVANSAVSWLAIWLYNIFMVYRYRTTLGKHIFRLRIVNAVYGPLTLKSIVLRETIGRLISTYACLLGYLWVGLDERKQGWHDKLANTFVIRARDSRPLRRARG